MYRGFTSIGDTMRFAAGTRPCRDLWRSDGTDAGTM
jgi:hypothetical protein